MTSYSLFCWVGRWEEGLEGGMALLHQSLTPHFTASPSSKLANSPGVASDPARVAG